MSIAEAITRRDSHAATQVGLRWSMFFTTGLFLAARAFGQSRNAICRANGTEVQHPVGDGRNIVLGTNHQTLSILATQMGRQETSATTFVRSVKSLNFLTR